MFSTNSQIDSLSDLFREVRDYVDVRYRYLRLDCVAKLSVLLSALVLGVMLAVVFAVALLFLAYTLSLAIAPCVGGMHVACAIVAAVCLLLGGIIYLLRRWIIVQPLTAFIAHLFLDKEPHIGEDTSDNRRKEDGL